MKCPICGESPLVHAIRDLPYSYRGQSTTIPDVSGDYCRDCKEFIFTHEAGSRYGKLIQAFRKQVDAGVDSSAFVRAVRRKLGLGKREAGELFGGGADAFSRYETGKETPPVALIKLLRLLDRHPELLDEIRADGKDAAAGA
ncbi:type II TA system antitoxin MqsA family protein [Massilia niastensis]|uniref:type II TA system antitoxin MqsA family protein n=1 Tax=Massilia niastensis TaxID=544911 RepID=UPI0004766A0A|nr:type II TA system antitoxin MqsA family protein [Massilia niastensis]